MKHADLNLAGAYYMIVGGFRGLPAAAYKSPDTAYVKAITTEGEPEGDVLCCAAAVQLGFTLYAAGLVLSFSTFTYFWEAVICVI